METLSVSIPLWVLLLYIIYSAAVQALPRPDETCTKKYVWFYQFTHLLAGNLALFFDPRKHDATKSP